ncbi:hypothetical protein ASPVEDRAFT_65730 [Aspergillus versicolor CBS 583.65]|uniref:Major facilitator superfamily (MFS) profile domain-containing protein n=1 Tax=Aspergillus versicolor CBS 583.65 TaxID=1036611 RepID=A0A1L9Q0V7_ASPVE|nr:uncharacterized protein ASPVEDRAFT_65730 [Aspergillus versicolor CBS 583.65]OJJ07312.1 hypothetical protein ASPVEDRAFT_65730 [Aspergillus versicolor CBS 583.65]
MLPVLVVSYMLQYLDKATMSNAAILGLRDDLHLTGNEYSWASSLFNFGYLAASGPMALIIVKFPIGKAMAFPAAWAVVLCCMGATQNAAGLMATRFFLGFTEAAVAPGFSIITSMWYKRSEQPLRHGVWFLGNVISGLFSGPLMYAFGHVHNFPPWRLVFIVFGAITLVWGLCLVLLLPDSPSTAWFLSETQRVGAVDRVKEDITGVKHNSWKKDQVIEALKDPKTWFSVLIMLCANIPNRGISNFAAIVIHGFGFSTNETFLVIGAVVIRQVDNSHLWARYSRYCLLSAYTVNFRLLLSINVANTAGVTKKATVNYLTFIAYCTGNIIGPQLFFEDESPSYPSGFAAMLVCLAVEVLLVLGLRFYLVWENKRRALKLEASSDPAVGEGADGLHLLVR